MLNYKLFYRLNTVLCTYHPKLLSSRSSIGAKEHVAILALDSQPVASLNALLHVPVCREANVELSLISCSCGSYHVKLCALSTILPGEVLMVPASHGEPKLFVQFDASSHRLQKIGGAGAALLQVSSRGITLLKWASLAIPKVCR